MSGKCQDYSYKERGEEVKKFILPHMYLFFGIILFVLAESVVYAGTLYNLTVFISISCILVGLIWNVALLIYPN